MGPLAPKFFRVNIKVQLIKQKILINLTFSKLNISAPQKKTLKGVKRPATNWVKVFAEHIFDKD